MPKERPPRKPIRTQQKTEMTQQQVQHEVLLVTTNLVGGGDVVKLLLVANRSPVVSSEPSSCLKTFLNFVEAGN